MLEVALRFKNIANIFLIHADDLRSLELAFRRIAEAIGHDLLASKYLSADIAAIWRGFGPSQMVAAFKAWLREPVNQPVLFMVDDLDRLKDATTIEEALPREAQIILCSTRDPSIAIESMDRISTQFRIQNMDIEETISLLRMVLHRNNVTVSDIDISPSEVEAIARTVHGHALAACRAISYIINVIARTAEEPPISAFLHMMDGPDWQARSQFLNYKRKMGPSLMETFEMSLHRLPGDQVPTIRFLELLTFLSCKDQSLDCRNFLGMKRPWLQEMSEDLPDYEIFAATTTEQGKYLEELENVSIGFRTTFRGPLQIHPLWIECIQQRTGQEGSKRWIRQILLLCLESWTRGESEAYDMLRPFACNALDIAERFQIRISLPLEVLGLQRSVISLDQPNEIELVPATIQPSSNAGPIELEANEIIEPVRVQGSNQPAQATPLYDTLSTLLHDCERMAEVYKNAPAQDLTEEATQAGMSRYIVFLRRLQAIEESDGDLGNVGEETNLLHLRVYDTLIGIAPSFKHRNATLVEMLGARRRIYVRG